MALFPHSSKGSRFFFRTLIFISSASVARKKNLEPLLRMPIFISSGSVARKKNLEPLLIFISSGSIVRKKNLEPLLGGSDGDFEIDFDAV